MSESLLVRAQREGTPLIDGERVTFVWRGRQDAPRLLGDVNDWDEEHPIPLLPQGGGVWACTLVLPRDAYIEYTFVRGERHLPDPFNARVNGRGAGANACFYMPEGGPTPLRRRGRGVPQGVLTRHLLDTDGLAATARRAVTLYRPPTDAPCPLVVVFDGQDYLRHARLAAIVDNLIAQERIRPIALALVAHGGAARMVEYGCNEVTLGFLMHHVVPLAQAELSLVDLATAPGAFGLVGGSMGGLMALYGGLRLPHIFGHVLSQSGAFDLEHHDAVVFDLVRHGLARDLRVWLDVGRFESLLESNRRMHVLLRERDYPVAYREFAGGHNFVAWRDDVAHGLEWLYGRG